ncbi:14315_t:CDS:1, partial [Gigaspora rosea]
MKKLLLIFILTFLIITVSEAANLKRKDHYLISLFKRQEGFPCLSSETPCGDFDCCTSTEVCTDEFCCDKSRVCGSGCCLSSTEVCVSNLCCDQVRVCGGGLHEATCCDATQTCVH